jgi:hypothetical protein
VPEKLFVLLSQRRRWINGSWFALIETWRNFGRIGFSSHTRWRRIWFTIELIYFTATILVSWVMVGSFYFFAELIFGGLMAQYPVPGLYFMNVSEMIMAVYIGLLLLVFMMSLGVKTSRVEGTYRCIAICFTFYMMIGFLVLNYFTFAGADKLDNFSLFLLVSMMGSYAIGVVITKNTKKVLFRTVQFLAITPVYVNMFGIYSVCNIHDCSWGNRPEVMTEEEIMKVDDFQQYRTKWVILWIISNVAYVKIMETLILVDPAMWALKVLFTLAVILILFRFIGCMYHYINWFIENRGGTKRYIHLSPADNTAKQNNKLLNELVTKVNKSVVMNRKKLRNSILGTIEQKSRGRLGNTFHNNLTKMIKQSEIYDSEDEDDYSDENDEDEDEEENMQKSRFKRSKSRVLKKNKTLMQQTRILKELNDPNYNGGEEEKKSEKKDENGVLNFSAENPAKEEKPQGILKKPQMADENGVLDFSPDKIENNARKVEKLNYDGGNKDQNGVLDFDHEDDFNPGRDQIDNFMQNKEVDLTQEGVLNFEHSAHNGFEWDMQEEEGNAEPQPVVESVEMDIESEDTEEENRYLEMLPSIIKSISDSED